MSNKKVNLEINLYLAECALKRDIADRLEITGSSFSRKDLLPEDVSDKSRLERRNK